MSATTRLEFADRKDYENRVEIQVSLQAVMSQEDYETVVKAARKILTTTGKYIPRVTEKKEGDAA